MISQVESFLYSDKQGTPEEGQRIQQPKHVSTNNHKDEDNSKKITTKIIQMILFVTVNGNEEVLNIPQSSRTAASPSAGLVSYPGYLEGC